MTGQWIKRDVDAHRCARPKRGGNTVRAGDQWKCDGCQIVHVVKGLDHGDQRDPIHPPMIVWEPVTGQPIR